jgi:hypothetical protein
MGSTNKCTRLMLISTILKLQNGGRGGQNFLIFFKDLNASQCKPELYFTTINQCDMCNNYYKSWQFFYNLLSNDKAF